MREGGAEDCQHKPQNGTMASLCFLSIASSPCLCLYFNKVVVHLCWDRQAAGQLDAYTVTPLAAVGVCLNVENLFMLMLQKHA